MYVFNRDWAVGRPQKDIIARSININLNYFAVVSTTVSKQGSEMVRTNTGARFGRCRTHPTNGRERVPVLVSHRFASSFTHGICKYRIHTIYVYHT